jgi:putative transcriptional regulator
MKPEHSLKNQLLIAMPSLRDPRFQHSVSLICEHTDEGAMGIIINRPTPITLSDLLPQMGISTTDVNQTVPVLEGGPVEPEHGFVIHAPRGKWRSSLKIDGDLTLTTSRDILEQLPTPEAPAQYLIALGYAGWSPGQLEHEMGENSWLTVPATHDLLFNVPYSERWRAAAAVLGVDISQIATQAGHA